MLYNINIKVQTDIKEGTFLGFDIFLSTICIFIKRVLYSGSKITHVYYFFQPQFYKTKEEKKMYTYIGTSEILSRKRNLYMRLKSAALPVFLDKGNSYNDNINF